ncbi:universal stress protein UspA [Bacillus sp. LL01]|uniref:universal stress protein n=1 Tax=Bacillus sp. LL01 TaxID=1665556 RepID=UPI00064CF205|nr:universal stress protein [Bacillus sp. LL01]KMJ60134.1 universal stress protein UspA [Bacillus sp. LL01]
MIKKILIALDGSKHAQHAARKAAELAMQLKEITLTIIHVVEEAPPKSKLVLANFDVEKVLRNDAYEKLIHTIRAFTEKNLEFELEVAIGEPAEEIVRVSKEKQMDLIIIGSRGLTTFGEVIFGSVSHQVLHDAKCPVMVVK